MQHGERENIKAKRKTTHNQKHVNKEILDERERERDL